MGEGSAISRDKLWWRAVWKVLREECVAILINMMSYFRPNITPILPMCMHAPGGGKSILQQWDLIVRLFVPGCGCSGGGLRGFESVGETDRLALRTCSAP